MILCLIIKFLTEKLYDIYQNSLIKGAILIVIVCRYGSWIYNYLCNQCLSPLSCEFKPCSWRNVLDTTLCDKICQWHATGPWFFLGTLVSSTNKTDCHDITEILLTVALITITLTLKIKRFEIEFCFSSIIKSSNTQSALLSSFSRKQFVWEKKCHNNV